MNCGLTVYANAFTIYRTKCSVLEFPKDKKHVLRSTDYPEHQAGNINQGPVS